jgi:DNA processing protein
MPAICLESASAAFPPRLHDIPDAPTRLWVLGDPASLAGHAVAIVGSRRASPGSLELARRLGRDLAAIGLTVVSGLARGCDAAAHRGALDAGGRTVAVLGSGIDVLYPPEHDRLASEISERGAVISEFSPEAAPLPFRFRQRNRLISGLALGVVVIEANERSGSLITAGCALAQGREVMVVPGTVYAGRNRGGHLLIRDGAALVENAEDVLGVLTASLPPPSSVNGTDPTEDEAPTGDPVLDALDPEDPQEFDELARRLPVAPGELLTRLADLELAGRIVRVAGGRFVRSKGK